MKESSIDFGLVKISAVSPKLHLADVPANVREIGAAMRAAADAGTAVVVFPELALTGRSCGDLFFQNLLLREAENGLARLAELAGKLDITAIVGAPVLVRGRVYACGIVLGGDGKILGAVPKTHIPNAREHCDGRWFASASELPVCEIELAGNTVPAGADLIFEAAGRAEFCFGIELCEDLRSVEPPSGKLALAGASVIFNLSADGETAGKAQFRRELVRMQSARCVAAYACACAGIGESSTDGVCAGECFIAQGGEILASTETAERFSLSGTSAVAQIDLEVLAHRRLANAESFAPQSRSETFRRVRFPLASSHTDIPAEIFGNVSRTPFMPAFGDDSESFSRYCGEAFEIQVAGLVRRISHTGAKKIVLGISGGLDSTLAILVAREAFARLGISPTGIVGISLPGPGTSARTRGNALDLMKRLGITAREISIVPAVEQHLRDIGHAAGKFDVTFENAQARERTQILMDVASEEGGFVVGTGDLSEAALGWCTFNGDHISMYHVNIGVPKTLIRHIIAWVAREKNDEAISRTLADIVDTPISPELTPPDAAGQIAQKTEDIVGPYELHDFFLFHFCENAFTPEKIRFLAENAFAGTFDSETIGKWLSTFLRRFFTQQFKRSVCPDGPKVLGLGLSPRGDWRMPSDARAAMWQR